MREEYLAGYVAWSQWELSWSTCWMKTSDSCLFHPGPARIYILQDSETLFWQLHYPAYSEINKQHLILGFFVQFLAENVRSGEKEIFQWISARWKGKTRKELNVNICFGMRLLLKALLMGTLFPTYYQFWLVYLHRITETFRLTRTPGNLWSSRST